MNITTKIVSIVVGAGAIAAVLGTTAIVGTAVARDGHSAARHDHHASAKRHAVHKSRRGLTRIEQFDTNKDGNVTQAEIDQARTDRLAKFDTNKDGKLSLQEFGPLWLDFTRQKMVRSFQRLDRDGDAVITMDEYLSPTRKMVERADRNNDNQLNRQDLRRRGGRNATPPAAPGGNAQ